MELSAFSSVSLKRAYQELEDYRQIDVQVRMTFWQLIKKCFD